MESSRKQHSADVIIGIGVGPGPNNIGRFTIPKNRRGEVGISIPYIRLNNGRFMIIPEAIYSSLKEIKDKREFSEGDIYMMIKEHEAMMAKAKEIANNIKV